MPIRTKRWNDAPEAQEGEGEGDGDGDGLRVLVCRYRPRGVRKDAEPWDAWMEDLGPSRELHAAFYGKEESPITWLEYRGRYLDEMMQPSGRGAAMLGALAARVAAGETVTLLCSSACVDAAQCHRTLLAELIGRAAERAAGRQHGRARTPPSR